MGKIGWIAYSIIVVGFLIICFMESEKIGFVVILGLALGCWGGGLFPWDNFRDSDD